MKQTEIYSGVRLEVWLDLDSGYYRVSVAGQRKKVNFFSPDDALEAGKLYVDMMPDDERRKLAVIEEAA